MNQHDLKGIYEEIWESLHEAIVDRHSGFHTFSLATICDSSPENRTVVLRGCDKEKMIISFHTNNYSEKIHHISKNNDVSALFYDKDKKNQIRISGIANINNLNSYCMKKWNDMSQQSRKCYHQNIKPGEVIDSPDKVKNQNNDQISSSFSIIDIKIVNIDWLYLSASGHTRARFTKENNYSGEWIAP